MVAGRVGGRSDKTRCSDAAAETDSKRRKSDAPRKRRDDHVGRKSPRQIFFPVFCLCSLAI